MSILPTSYRLWLLLLGIVCGGPLMAQPQWTSAGGPLGADATAFHIDGQGHYWLGTGSSGGIFRSQDRGGSWEPVNKGIGTAHVSWIGQLDGQFCIEVADEDSLTNWRSAHPFRMHIWQADSQAWVPVPNAANLVMVKQAWEESVARYERLGEMYAHEWEENSMATDKEGFINQEGERLLPRDWIGGSYSRRMASLTTPEGETLELPNDVFALRGWNFYENELGELVVLGKTHAYVLRGGKFEPMGKAGLLATDVYQTAVGPDGAVYAISNYRDLYRFAQGRWSILHDSHAAGKPMTDNAVSARINVHADGRIVTVIGGDICLVSEKGVKVLSAKRALEGEAQYKAFLPLFQEAYESDLEDGQIDLHFYNAAYDQQGRLWAYGAADGWYMLMRLDAQGQVEEVVYEDDGAAYGTGAFLASNPYTGHLWFFTDRYVQWLDRPEHRFPCLLDYATGHYGNLVAFAPNGDMAYALLSDVWQANIAGVSIIAFADGLPARSEYRAPLQSISCLGYDYRGQLFAGTGYQMVNPRDICGWGLHGRATGLYQLATDGWMPLDTPVNPWILSLAMHPKGLWVGTSGSGLYTLTQYPPQPWPPYRYVFQGGRKGMDYDRKPLYPAQYHDIMPYSVYYRVHGFDKNEQFAQQVAPGLVMLQEEEGGRWKAGDLQGNLTAEAFDGFVRLETGLLGFQIDSAQDGVRHYWWVDNPAQPRKLPHVTLWSFSKGFVAKEEDGSYRICNLSLEPLSRVPFAGFSQNRFQIFLHEAEHTTVWDIEAWESKGQVPFVGVGLRIGATHVVFDQNRQMGLFDASRMRMILPCYYDSLQAADAGWLAFREGWMGLYNEDERRWDLEPGSHRLLYWVRSDSGPVGGGGGDPFFEEEEEPASSAAVAFSLSPTQDVLILQDSAGRVGLLDANQPAMDPGDNWLVKPAAIMVRHLAGDAYIWEEGGEQGIYHLPAKRWLLPKAAQQLHPSGNPRYARVAQGGLEGLFDLTAKEWMLPQEFDRVELLAIEAPTVYAVVWKGKKCGLWAFDEEAQAYALLHPVAFSEIRIGQNPEGMPALELWKKKAEAYHPLPLPEAEESEEGMMEGAEEEMMDGPVFEDDEPAEGEDDEETGDDK